MRALAERRQVNEWIARGASDYAIAGITGVPRSTVRRWRAEPTRGPQQQRAPGSWRPPDPAAYAYLLGLYLGDGCLSATGSPLMLAFDARYPGIVDMADATIRATVPGAHPRRYRPGGEVIRLVTASGDWRDAFPQHGPGRKHERAIVLTTWQLMVTRAFTREFLRGLIHSDGCRTINRFTTKLPSGRVRTYEYPRYFFSNESEDIRRIFCAHCELLSIRWTQSNRRNISVSHRDSVALMDEFIGPKY